MEEWKSVVDKLYKKESGQSLFNETGNINKKAFLNYYVQKKGLGLAEKIEEKKEVSVEIPEVMMKDGEYILSIDMLNKMGELSLEDILFLDDAGNLHIDTTPEALVKLAVKSIDNLIQSFENQIAGIEKGQHNDRVAKFATAEDHYDLGEYKEAKENLFDGINKLEEEIRGELDVLCKIPKSAIKKLFCGTSLADAKCKISNLESGVACYVRMLELLFKVGQKTGQDLEKIYQKKREFIKEEFGEERVQRLVELTGEEDRWEVLPDRINEAITGYTDLQRTKCLDIAMEG